MALVTINGQRFTVPDDVADDYRIDPEGDEPDQDVDPEGDED